MVILLSRLTPSLCLKLYVGSHLAYVVARMQPLVLQLHTKHLTHVSIFLPNNYLIELTYWDFFFFKGDSLEVSSHKLKDYLISSDFKLPAVIVAQ